MKHITALMTLLLCTMCLSTAYAVTIYECVDEAGNSTFQDHCPPGTTPANERDIKTGSGAEEATEDTATEDTAEAPAGDVNIVFYTTSTECDACLIIKDTLTKYGASFTEKDVNRDFPARDELQKITGATSSITVPTVIIGDQVIVGSNKPAVIKALESAGYSGPEPVPVLTTPEQAPAPNAESSEPEEEAETYEEVEEVEATE